MQSLSSLDLLCLFQFYDGFGALTFLSSNIYSLISNGNLFPRQIASTFMVGAWATRLGTMLVRRVFK